jgi:predicted AlkP superfamily phosphohydrolase/phosphomutase
MSILENPPFSMARGMTLPYYPAMHPVAPVLMIGLDAGDPVLIERWTDDGTLPNLARLRREGTYGRLASSARHLAGSPWPTFYTGQPASQHGIYHDYQWHHESMGYARPTWDWLSAVPFWRTLEPARRVVAFDVPMTLGCHSATGVEVTGWASHDSLGPPQSHPPELIDDIRKRFGEWPVGHEAFGRSSVGELLALRRKLLEATHRSARLAAALLEREWDLAIVVFGALHRGGHRLFDRSSIDGPVDEAEGAEFDEALKSLYVACDQAIGELLAASRGAAVIAFSLHGMMPNTTRIDLLDGMLTRVLQNGSAAPARRSLVRRFGEALPKGLRGAVTAAVPGPLRNALVTRWSTGGMDWTRTTAFTLRADLQGYVRVNLAGREARGVVPETELRPICDRIADGLLQFRDAEDGAPVVAEVLRAADVFPDGPRRDRLPDLLVLWPDSPGGVHRSVTSSRYGSVERATPGQIPNGRSGNHRPQGFFVARGVGFPEGGRLQPDAHILDLAPTVLAALEATSPEPLAGRPLGVSGGRP